VRHEHPFGAVARFMAIGLAFKSLEFQTSMTGLEWLNDNTVDAPST
jgi:hypothetical protein